VAKGSRVGGAGRTVTSAWVIPTPISRFKGPFGAAVAHRSASVRSRWACCRSCRGKRGARSRARCFGPKATNAANHGRPLQLRAQAASEAGEAARRASSTSLDVEGGGRRPWRPIIGKPARGSTPPPRGARDRGGLATTAARIGGGPNAWSSIERGFPNPRASSRFRSAAAGRCTSGRPLARSAFSNAPAGDAVSRAFTSGARLACSATCGTTWWQTPPHARRGLDAPAGARTAGWRAAGQGGRRVFARQGVAWRRTGTCSTSSDMHYLRAEAHVACRAVTKHGRPTWRDRRAWSAGCSSGLSRSFSRAARAVDQRRIVRCASPRSARRPGFDFLGCFAAGASAPLEKRPDCDRASCWFDGRLWARHGTLGPRLDLPARRRSAGRAILERPTGPRWIEPGLVAAGSRPWQSSGGAGLRQKRLGNDRQNSRGPRPDEGTKAPSDAPLVNRSMQIVANRGGGDGAVLKRREH